LDSSEEKYKWFTNEVDYMQEETKNYLKSIGIDSFNKANYTTQSKDYISNPTANVIQLDFKDSSDEEHNSDSESNSTNEEEMESSSSGETNVTENMRVNNLGSTRFYYYCVCVYDCKKFFF